MPSSIVSSRHWNLPASQSSSNVSHSTIQGNSSTSQQASVEAVDNDDNINCHNARSLRNLNTILELADDNGDDIYVTNTHGTVRDKRLEAETVEESEETDEDELSQPILTTKATSNVN